MHFNYRSEVDGLRALAVVATILFHAGFPRFSGGFIGVDVFFVISGYLITSILIKNLDAGRFSLLNFYERRARRILPALYSVVVVAGVVAVSIMTPKQLHAFSLSVYSTLAFLSNLFFWRQGGYFGSVVEQMPLLHTWSLGVEEQFYIVFPLLLAFLWRRTGLSRGLLAILGLGVIAGFLFTVWAEIRFPKAAFYLAPARAGQLMAGSFCAVLLAVSPEHRYRAREIAGFIGLALILYAILSYGRDTPYPGVSAILPTLGTCLLIVFCRADTIVGRILSLRPVVTVGLISYSLYLWHFPLFAFARVLGATDESYLLFSALSLLSFPLAYASWRWVESPFRQPGRVSKKQLLVFSLGVPVAVAGLLYVAAAPINKRLWGPDALHSLKTESYYKQHKYPCFLLQKDGVGALADECIAVEDPQWILWGDSHAASLYPGFSQASRGQPHWQLTTAGCPPISGMGSRYNAKCRINNEDLYQRILESPARQVLLAASWFAYHQFDAWEDHFARTVAELTKKGKQVYVIGSLPRWKPDLPVMIAWRLRGSGQSIAELAPQFPVAEMDELERIDAQLKQIAERNGGRFVSIINGICEADLCTGLVAGASGRFPIAWDYAHLTEEGAALVGAVVESGLD